MMILNLKYDEDTKSFIIVNHVFDKTYHILVKL